MSNESSEKKDSANLAELANTYWWIPAVLVLGTLLMGSSSSSSSSKSSTSSAETSSTNAALVGAVAASIVGGGSGGDGHFLNAVPSALFPRARASGSA